MKNCPICNSENNENAEKCIVCGNIFQNVVNTSQPNENNTLKDNISDSIQHNTPNESFQNIPQNQVNYQQQPQNQYNNQAPLSNQNQFNNQNQYQQYQNRPPQNQKSKAVGLILNMLLVGLGYAYVGKWGEGIVLVVIYLLMWLLGFILLFPFIIALAIWIYSLFKTNEMIDKYNQGLPY